MDRRHATLGIACVRRALNAMKGVVEKQGSLTEDELAVLTDMCGVREGSLSFALSAVSSIARGDLQEADNEEPSTRPDSPSPEKCKEVLLDLIDSEITRLTNEAELVARKERLEWDAAVLARHLPSDEILGKILRYETAIERQMYRALKELRELQAARRARSTRLRASDNGA